MNSKYAQLVVFPLTIAARRLQAMAIRAGPLFRGVSAP